MTAAFNLSQLANNLNTSGQLDATDGLYGSLPVANGGTGKSTLTAASVLVGNGTSAISEVAPTASGTALVSNGSSWSGQYISRLNTTSGSAPIYGARAFGNFSSVSGGITYISTANVFSISYNGTGSYYVTFNTAMPSNNYAVVFGFAFNYNNTPFDVQIGNNRTSVGFGMLTGGSVGRVNMEQVCFAVFV